MSTASTGLSNSALGRKDSSLGAAIWGIGKSFLRVFATYVVLIALTTAIHFPYHTDRVENRTVPKQADAFYTGIYAAPAAAPADAQPAAGNDSDYVVKAQEAISREQIVPRVQSFVNVFGLKDKHVLDVGAGTGYLQDLVDNYVGLDISPAARRFFHKPFVQASATEMPFADGDFDAAWSIWVMEHVPNPEQGLSEMRRVVKDGGLLYLLPAWNCTPWAAEGYPVRPYSAFGVKGKLIKASLNILEQPWFKVAYLIPTRFVRQEATRLSGGPTRLHYTQLTANYDQYWMSDSDAINSIDYFETLLWFTSRGDECLSCGPTPIYEGQELVIRVHKRP